jgi:hypothetical protein
MRSPGTVSGPPLPPEGADEGRADLIERISRLRALVREARGRPLAPEEATAVAALIETLGVFLDEES